MINVPRFNTFTYESASINTYHVNKGEGLLKHTHDYSHATICHNGSCIIRMEDKEITINKESGAFNLPQGKWHEIEALEDNTVFVNIFAKEFQGTY
jgi:hypothetical protein